ncbi:unnamed protein product, partial [Allacma fusca]
QGSASSAKSGGTSIPNLRGSPILARKSAKETAQAAFRGSPVSEEIRPPGPRRTTRDRKPPDIFKSIDFRKI